MAEPATRTMSWAPPPLSGVRALVVNVALSGIVPRKRDNPTLPVTTDEIVDCAVRCADAGASVVHVHARDEHEEPVHRRDLYEAMLAGIRARRPDLIVCVTTSSRAGGDPSHRFEGLEVDGELLPDLASLTLGSYNTPRGVNVNPPDEMVRLLERMQELGVRPELEIFELGMVNTLWSLRDRGLVPDPPIANVLLGVMGASAAFVGDLARIVERLPPGTEWAVAGIGRFQRPMTLAAAAMGGNVRTGLEDNPRDTSPSWSNVEAVEFVTEVAALAERPVATTAEARARFGLKPVATVG
ncbi:MAG TPA: 3-keto-5-aminohexanoate cleavage protein [Gaiellaceae bacterium]|nr:3-keto-5-aminohexanoate cleavage protein [Gaiellaceae bacterium]